MTRILAILALSCTWLAQAQGTVSFANIGGGVNAPVTGPDGLLGAGWIAQLCFEDETPIGEPTPFLANGLFSGGQRTVPGFQPGETVELVVKAQDSTGLFSIKSSPFSVVLGGGSLPPAAMTNMTATSVAILLGNCSFLEANTGHPCWWTDPPWILEQEGNSPAPKLPLPDKEIQYKVMDNGRLELRWPSEYRLVRSRQVGGGRISTVSPHTSESGQNIWSVATTAPQFFFWLR